MKSEAEQVLDLLLEQLNTVTKTEWKVEVSSVKGTCFSGDITRYSLSREYHGEWEVLTEGEYMSVVNFINGYLKYLCR